MPKSVLSRGRKWTARFAVLAMVASLMAIAVPVGAQVQDTSNSCPDTIPSAGFTDLGGLDATTVQAIDCLVFYDISKGTSTTTFSPTLSVPRWQMALFLTRQAEVHGVTLPDGSPQGFTDIGGLDAATQTAINQLAQLGITTGTTATTFSPFDVVSRWQMALFLTRLVDAAGVTLPDGSDQGYTDISGQSAAAQTAINQVTQLGIAQGTSATTFVPTGATLRWQMALFLTRTLAADGILPPESAAATGAPELLNVTIGSTFGGETQLIFDFDEDVPVVDPGKFYIALVDGTLIGANDADTTVSDESVVEVEFWEEDVEYATAAAVDFDAVTDEDDVSGIPSGVGIQNLTLGDNLTWPQNDGDGGDDDFPEIIGIDDFDDDLDAVELEIDVDVDSGACDPALFFLIEDSGAVWNATGGDCTDDTDDDEFVDVEGFVNVLPAFGEDGHDTDFSQADFDNIARVFAAPAAIVQDGADMPPHAFDVSSSGATTAPYLVGVEVTDGPDGEWDFEFSDTLVDFATGTAADDAFHLVMVDGTFATSLTAARDDDDTDIVNVEFADNTIDPDLVVIGVFYDATADIGVVEDASQPAVWDSVRWTQSFASGETAGPELNSASTELVGFDNDAALLSLGFDEDLLDDDGALCASQPWACDFLGFKANGDDVPLDADEIDDLVGSAIDLLFDAGEEDTDDFVDGEIEVIGVQVSTLPEDEYGNTSYPDSLGN